MSIWVPPRTAAELRQKRAAELLEQAETLSHLRDWNRELQVIDPRLQLVRARDDSRLPGLKPGFYHVILVEPGVPPQIIIHEGPNGEFLEPDSGLLERLRKGDMWSDRSIKERERKQKRLQRAAENRRKHEREERVEEAMERAKAAWNPGTLIPSDIPKGV